MRSPTRHLQLPARALSTLAVLAVAAVLPAGALGAPKSQGGRAARSPWTLVQLPGSRGCLVDRSQKSGSCGSARALQGPATLLGSRAVALSPGGRNLYVASATSDAIAIFTRNAKTGALTQAQGTAGCIAAKAAGGCAPAIALDGPNSVAVSPDGRNVYATSLGSESIAVFRRDPTTGALSQPLDGSGCLAVVPLPTCATVRGVGGPDVITVSPDGRNVYVGSFFGNAVAVFDRNPVTGALTQPADTTGCLTEAPTSGCATGRALEGIEGMAISNDGSSVYLGAAVSEALVVLSRNPSTGALTEAGDGSGCIVTVPLAGCTTGAQLGGADAVAVSPDDKSVYVTSLFSKSLTSFTRSSAGTLTQKSGPAGCLVFLRAVGCSFGRALSAPEGLAVSPDGANVYAASYEPGTIAVLNRDRRSGVVAQKPLGAGCVGSVADCAPARGLSGLGSLVVSPDGRFVYAAASKSNAISVFRRILKAG
jgi:DNA-binding beta-propeller fold protein YncE